MEKLKEKIYESFSSVFPITVIVLVVSVLVVPLPLDTIVMFLVGALILVLGMGFFQLGAEMSMIPLGEGVGVALTKSKKIFTVILVSFLIGFLVTVAEPDLMVLANQVPAVPDMVLIGTVAVGVGVFLMLAILRILFKISLSQMLIVFYLLVFITSIFAPNSFVAVAFDSGGVTTGPITVPFIMSLGLGLSRVRGDKNSKDDSFGLVSVSSIGPILAVLLLGIIYRPDDASYTPVTIPEVHTSRDVVRVFLVELPHYFKEVLVSIAAIVLFFIAFELLTKRFRKRQTRRVFIGFLYTLIGLGLFLTGVNVGFIPVGYLMGSELASLSIKWILIPISMLVGYFIVLAEPAVHVLNKQVEEVTGGSITPKVMTLCLSIGVAISLGLSMIRILLGISIYWMLIPGYSIALILTFFVPKIFTGIAFDSGGVVSGPMATTFLLPFAMGACEALGGNILTDAFGMVAMVAMVPLVVIQVMGLVYVSKAKRAHHAALDKNEDDDSDDIVEYAYEPNEADPSVGEETPYE